MDENTKPVENAPMVVAKAFDLVDLENRLRAKGIPALGGLAHELIGEVFAWIEDGVKGTDTKWDDFALAVLPPLKNYIDLKIQKIAPESADKTS